MEFSTTLTTSYLANGVSAALTTPSARLPYKATFDSVSPLLPRAAHAASHQSAKAHLHDSFHVSDWISRTRRNTVDEFTSRSQSGLASLATPRASNTPQTVKPETATLSVDADGTYFWIRPKFRTPKWRSSSGKLRRKTRSQICTYVATRQCATNGWRRLWLQRSKQV